MEQKSMAERMADYLAGELSAEEVVELRELLKNDTDAERMLREVREAEGALRMLKGAEQVDVQAARCRFDRKRTRVQRYRYLVRRRLLGGVAAAVVVLVALIWPREEKVGQPDDILASAIIPHGEVKATLHFENGETLSITPETSGQVMTPEGVAVLNDSVEGLRYDCLAIGEVSWQRLEVPVGGEYRFTLADGTRVWVNSGTVVRFPTRFAGGCREIEVSGEVYLEVERDAQRPFVVHAGANSVRVLGTKFNLQAYPDEAEVVTTLVEGCVEFANESQTVRLLPGEQAVSDEVTGRVEKREVDVALYTSWVAGLFEFERMPLENIVRQLERWYDVRFEFEESDFRTHLFTGSVERNQPLHEALALIEKTTSVCFEIVDQIVYVKKAGDAANTSRLQ